nr:putative ribonuclease H-like domain-containing protein [Tanacetum cinerariifolium]
MIKVLPPKTAEEVVARKRERKARTALLMALPKDHLAKFHKMTDAKEIWEAIKSGFGGNDESKKMQKYLLKQQFEGFSVSTSEGLHKGSLPSSWSQVALIMRTKPGLDTLSFDDLYNNLRVFEHDVKGTTTSSSFNIQNVAFVYANNTSNTNDVSTAYSVSSLSVSKSQKEVSSSNTDEVIHSFFTNQSSAPQLDYNDLEQINDDDTEKMDFKWQLAMISMRIKKMLQLPSMRRFARDCRAKDDSKALVTIDGEDIDWSRHVEEDTQNYAMMAYSSSNSGSDNEESDLENTSVNDKYVEGMHAVPPLMTGNCMPYGPDAEIDYSKFTYGLEQTSVDESDFKPKDKEKPTFAFTDSVKHVRTSRENVKEKDTPNHCPKVKKHGRYSNTRKGLGYAFTRKACFVCGSFIHLIRDCDFHEKRMTKQAALTQSKNKVTGQRENRPVWNNVQRVNPQNKHRHMIGNKAHLVDYQDFKGGSITFGGSNGRITGKGKIKTSRLDFKNVYYVEELKHYNLFSVSQMCAKKNKVLFTDTDYLVLSLNFKLPDETQVLLKIPRQHNMYSFNLKNNDPSGDLSCLFVKASIDESNKLHKRLGHVNFKNLNKLVKGNLVRGLPFKIFENDDTCVACQKGKQHKASCKAKTVSFMNQPLQILHMYLSGPTSIRSISHNIYYLVTTDGFSRLKGIKREYSNARNPQQNGVAERKNKTLIEAARTMLGDSFLPTTFWQRVYNLKTKRVEENLHVNFLENKPNVAGKGHAWMFDPDYLTNSMNYEPVLVENQANKFVGPKEANNSAGTQANDDQSVNLEEIDLHEEHFVLPIWSAYSTTVKSSGDKIQKTTDFKTCEKPVSQVEQIFQEELEKLKRQEKEANDAASKEATHEYQDANTNSTNLLNDVSTPISTAGPLRALNDDEPLYPDDPLMPHLEDIYACPSEEIFTDSSYDDKCVVTDFNNLETTVNCSLTPTTRIHTIHPKTQILIDHLSAAQTRSKENKNSKAHALEDESWVDAMQEELLQFQIQKVWILVDLPFGKKAIGTKWVYRNKKVERGVVVRNKAQPVAQGHRQEEGIDFDEVFDIVARIEAIRIFLAFASYMGFIVYQMDVKSAFLYGTIDEEVYVTQPPSFVDPKFYNKVYKVLKALYGLHQALRAWYATKSWCDKFKELMKNRFQMSSMGELTFFLELQVKQKEDGIFISQDKYVAKILKKFDFLSVKTASTPIETWNPLVKDKEAADMDVHLYRSMIGSLIYLTTSRPDIMFAVCACSRFQATVAIKKVNNVVKLRALINGKRVVITKDVIRQDLRLDDADGVKCLPNEDRFTKLARMGYKKPPPKLTFYKAFFSAQWKFLIHTPVQCINAKRKTQNEFSYSMTSAVICLATVIINAQVDDLSSHTNQYTSLALTQKVFAYMRRVSKGFSGVETPLFATMIVQPQPLAAKEEDETCATLSQKVAHLEQDKIAQALEIIKLKKRVQKLEKKRRYKSSGLKRLRKVGRIIEAIDVDDDVTPVDVETQVDLGAELQGRKDNDNAAIKDASAVEPTVFDDEEVTMTMAQTLIKMKFKKARLFDEQIAKRLHDEEVEQATTRAKQGKDNLKKAKGLQQHYVDKKENIDWNVVVEQMQEKHLDNIKKYQSLKRKAISIAQSKKNMNFYLKNIAGYKMEHFKGMNYDKVRPIFEREYNKVQTLFKPDKDVEEPQKKRVAEETLLQESFKKLKAVEVSGFESTQDTLTIYPKEISIEDVKNMLEIVPVFEVSGITEAYQSFKDMLKGFDKQDLDALWRLVKEKFSTTVPIVDKEKALWVEVKRLFEPDIEDVLWKLQRYMHYPLTWKLHSDYGVHQVSSTMRRHDMFMSTKKNYPLSNEVMTLMLSAKLQVEEDSDIARDLVMKIFMKANKPKSKSFDTSSN